MIFIKKFFEIQLGIIPAHAFSRFWQPNLFWGINKKSAPILNADCTATHILKISRKKIEKCGEEASRAKPTFEMLPSEKWDIDDFVHYVGCYAYLSYKAGITEKYWYLTKL